VVRRILAAAMAVGALVLGACETDSGDDHVSYGGYYDGCRNYTSCGTCTPVNGCGWCCDADGTGLCASSPDECVTPAFSWTWNPSGCRIPADAGAVQASSDAETAPQPEPDAAAANDGAPVEDAVAAREGGAAVDSGSLVPEASVSNVAPVP
jgi:hypothetical protein